MASINYKQQVLLLLLLVVLVCANPATAQTSNDGPPPESTASPTTETNAKNPEPEKLATVDTKRTATRAAKFEFKPRPQDPDNEGWHFTFTPYAWIAGISGNVAVDGIGANVDAKITDDGVNLNFGFMSTFDVRKDKFVFLTDLQYSNLGVDRATTGPLFGGAEAEFKTFVLDPEIGYRVASGSGSFLDVLGGVRIWHLRTDLTLTPGILAGRTATDSRSWIDAVAGVRGHASVTKKLFVMGKADIGGGGSKLTYQLFGGGGLQLTSRFALVGGYRHLKVNYDKDNFLFDTFLAGPVVGMSFKF